jgi:hypothetical protein
MCHDCFEKYIYRFESLEQFKKLDDLIFQKQKDKKLSIETEIKAPEEISLLNTIYRCNTCKEIWLLSAPDFPWKGYFMPEQAVANYVEMIEREGKTRNYGCWLVIIIVSIVIYIIYSKLR